jgi:2-dehydro-3-deoxyphosphooctonate aldolase (KDO 8-P synthase)
VKTVSVQNLQIGENLPLAFFAGPCVIENRDHTMQMAESIKNLGEETGAAMIFKASYDKANRSSVESYRGPGVEEGARIFEDVATAFEIPIITDVHEPWQVDIIKDVAHVLQVPAFLCRQTDLVVAIAESQRVVNVKKGQFLAPWDIEQVIGKITAVGNQQILITERGASFGYNNLVSDMRAIPIMQNFNYPVVFDATHSAQLPGGQGETSGGMRNMIPYLSRAAVAAGANAVFMEVHDNPEQAKSDSATQWPLEKAKLLIQQLQEIRSLVKEMEDI